MAYFIPPYYNYQWYNGNPGAYYDYGMYNGSLGDSLQPSYRMPRSGFEKRSFPYAKYDNALNAIGSMPTLEDSEPYKSGMGVEIWDNNAMVSPAQSIPEERTQPLGMLNTRDNNMYMNMEGIGESMAAGQAGGGAHFNPQAIGRTISIHRYAIFTD